MPEVALDEVMDLVLIVAKGFPPFRPDQLGAIFLLADLARQRYARGKDANDIRAAIQAAEQLEQSAEPRTPDSLMELLLHSAGSRRAGAGHQFGRRLGLATATGETPCSNNAAARRRTCSRRARPEAVKPPPSGYLTILA